LNLKFDIAAEWRKDMVIEQVDEVVVSEPIVENSPRFELEEPLLTINQVAEILHVHPNTVRAWSNNGLLPALRVGRRGDRRFSSTEVRRFLVEAGYKLP
jgi:excisionase family DNA binding protein